MLRPLPAAILIGGLLALSPDESARQWPGNARAHARARSAEHQQDLAGAHNTPLRSAVEKYPGDLDQDLQGYLGDPALFWSKFAPKDEGGGLDYGETRDGLKRRCGAEECEASARPVAGATRLSLNRINRFGTVVALYRLTKKGPSGEGREKKYQLDADDLGAFLIAYSKAGIDANYDEGGWRLLRIRRVGNTWSANVMPGLHKKPWRMTACKPYHEEMGDVAGFESCNGKHAALALLHRPTSLAEMIASLDRVNAEEARLGLPDDTMWVSCHAGCCRASF